MRILRLGDPHVTVSNMADSQKIIDLVYSKALEHKVDTIEILGDLHHNHSLVRIEVDHFWQNAVRKLSKACKYLIILEGNHDQPIDQGLEWVAGPLSKLEKEASNIKMVREYYKHPEHRIGYIGHAHNKEKFLTEVKKAKDIDTLVIHQTIDGAMFDNGFYAPDGIKLEEIDAIVPNLNIVCGHIHTHQILGGRVFMAGTPKWDTYSDINKEKGFWIHTDGTNLFVPSKDVISPLIEVVVKEGDDKDLDTIPKGNKTFVVLEGSSTWIKKISKSLEKTGVKIKAKPTDSVHVVNNVVADIGDYLDKYHTTVDKSKILKYINSL